MLIKVQKCIVHSKHRSPALKVNTSVSLRLKKKVGAHFEVNGPTKKTGNVNAGAALKHGIESSETLLECRKTIQKKNQLDSIIPEKNRIYRFSSTSAENKASKVSWSKPPTLKGISRYNIDNSDNRVAGSGKDSRNFQHDSEHRLPLLYYLGLGLWG